jgi:predicted phage-related endonuclease
LASASFEFERQRKTGDIPETYEDMMDELINISEAIKQMQEREKAIKQVVLSEMQKMGVDNWGNDLIQFTRKAAYERVTVDTALLKKKEPEIYESYKKVTKVAESVSYKVL